MTATGAVMRNAAREAFAKRSAFWTQLVAMAVNDIVWVLFWVLFFHQTVKVRGWDQQRILLLMAVLTTAGGTVLGLLSNCRRVGELVTNGGLDAALGLPVRPLRYILVRRIDPVNLGDLLFGITLFITTCHPTPERTAIYLLGSFCGAVVLTSFLVLTGSFTFFTSRTETGELGLHAMLLLASYPVDVFGGTTRLLLYTVVPAAFVAAAPAQLISQLTFGGAVILIAAAVAVAAAAASTFSLGLRRYTSSAIWTRA